MFSYCLAFCVALIVSGTVQARDAKEFPLKYRLTVSIAEEVGTAGQALTILSDRKPLKQEPTYVAAKPIYATLLLGADREEYMAVLDTSRPESREYDCLYLDANNDGRISPAEKTAGTPRDAGWAFGPLKLTVSSGGTKAPQWFLFYFVNYETEPGKRVRNLEVVNAGFYTGIVQFGSQRLRVALVDHNGNGLYNDYPRAGSWLGDRLLVDLDGNGEFDFRATSEETQPLGRYVLVGDRYWQVEVAADGGKIAVAPLDKPLGGLRCEAAGEFALLLRNAEGDLRVRGRGGVARLPAGTYALVRCQFVLRDSAGRRWVFTGAGEDKMTIEVPPNGPGKVTLGPPFVPKIEVTRIDKEKIALNLALRGQGNEIYNDIYYNDQIRPPAPKARLYDAGGREVAQLDFHYG
jgi:hypothetical protein